MIRENDELKLKYSGTMAGIPVYMNDIERYVPYIEGRYFWCEPLLYI